MTDRGRLPIGLTPRLLCRDAAAAYLGISANHFEEHVADAVPAIEIGRRKLWDIRALDRWLDERSGLLEPLRPVTDWLGGLGR
jgi:hypothetical protein